LLNTLIAVFGTLLIGQYVGNNKRWVLIGYVLVLLLTASFALALYPQEYSPHAAIQRWERIARRH